MHPEGGIISVILREGVHDMEFSIEGVFVHVH